MQTLLGVLDSPLCDESFAIRFKNDAVCYNVFRFYCEYEDVTYNIFCTPVTLDPPLHILYAKSRSCVTYVTASNISRADCNRYYNHTVLMFADTVKGIV